MPQLEEPEVGRSARSRLDDFRRCTTLNYPWIVDSCRREFLDCIEFYASCRVYTTLDIIVSMVVEGLGDWGYLWRTLLAACHGVRSEP